MDSVISGVEQHRQIITSRVAECTAGLQGTYRYEDDVDGLIKEYNEPRAAGMKVGEKKKKREHERRYLKSVNQ